MKKRKILTATALIGLFLLATAGLLLLLSEPQAESLTDWTRSFILSRLGGSVLLGLAAAGLHFGLKKGYLDAVQRFINEEE